MADLKAFYNIDGIEVGVDEAGRGCLAGDVFASAVILPKDFYHPLLNDSKKMTDKDRRILRPIIEENAIAWAVASVSAKEIDEINILNASILAMHRAIDKIKTDIDLILVDGNRFKDYKNIKHKTIIKGDSLYTSIAAASVLAKTYRDDYMDEMSTIYSGYGFEKHKGYPTKAHRMAISKLGASKIHRLSFKLI